jgi:hypothetical protein
MTRHTHRHLDHRHLAFARAIAEGKSGGDARRGHDVCRLELMDGVGGGGVENSIGLRPKNRLVGTR